MNLHKHQLS